MSWWFDSLPLLEPPAPKPSSRHGPGPRSVRISPVIGGQDASLTGRNVGGALPRLRLGEVGIDPRGELAIEPRGDAQEDGGQARIELRAGAACDLAQGCLESPALLVAAAADERVEDVADGADAAGKRDILPSESSRVAGPVPA